MCVDAAAAAAGIKATENEVPYTTCFERFIMQGWNCTINWIGKKPQMNAKEKCLLLLNVKSRIPEDFQCALDEIELTGKKSDRKNNYKRLKKNIPIFFMKNGYLFI